MASARTNVLDCTPSLSDSGPAYRLLSCPTPSAPTAGSDISGYAPGESGQCPAAEEDITYCRSIIYSLTPPPHPPQQLSVSPGVVVTWLSLTMQQACMGRQASASQWSAACLFDFTIGFRVTLLIQDIIGFPP
jgi:hypothetical protein